MLCISRQFGYIARLTYDDHGYYKPGECSRDECHCQILRSLTILHRQCNITLYHLTRRRQSRGGVLLTSVCLFVCLFFRTISQKLMEIGSQNLTQIFHDESLFRGQKVKRQGRESQKDRVCWRGSLHSCECWFLLVNSNFLLVK